MKCVNCGAEILDDTKFCPYCGKKLESSEAEKVIAKFAEKAEKLNPEKADEMFKKAKAYNDKFVKQQEKIKKVFSIFQHY